MRPLIAGNWKMNGRRGEAEALARGLCEGVARGAPAAELVVCPPFTALAAVGAALAGCGGAIGLGAQDCHAEDAGAHTGDISPSMLVDLGVRWVILGHSERRTDHGEIDEQVRQKVVGALAAGLAPIVCVGESDEQRSAGRETEIVGWQIEGSLPKEFCAEGCAGVIAYEPVWAIGTGKTPDEAQVSAMHAFIREELVRQFGEAGRGVRILYGGSVKPENAASLLALPEVGGALIGGASLKADSFLAIAQAAGSAAGSLAKTAPAV